MAPNNNNTVPVSSGHEERTTEHTNQPEAVKWAIKASPKALDTDNPIRSLIDNLKLQPNPGKSFISLSIGDPTVCTDLKPCPEITEALARAMQSPATHQLQPSVGSESARAAIAEYCSAYGMAVDAKDIIITSGCAQALELALTVLAAKPGANVLVPRPGFPLYKTHSTLHDIEIRYYNLQPVNGCWQIDLADLEAAIDHQTAAIIYNNPSNPCGSVFSRQHILDFLALAEKYCLPVIGDEIYEDLVFSGSQFHAIASLTDEVPVLHCSGTTKKFLLPGWRCGWIAINDKKGRFGNEIRHGLSALSQRIIGANTVIQAALPDILRKTPFDFFESTISYIEKNALEAYSKLKQIAGLTPIRPSGAFYLMVAIEMNCFPSIPSDLVFVERLVAEESVFCLPASYCFACSGYVRMVLAISSEQLKKAIARIEAFCSRYYQPKSQEKLDKPLSECFVKLTMLEEKCTHRRHSHW